MLYLYRTGDGNEGNYPRCVIELGESDDAYAALREIVLGEFKASAREWVSDNLYIDGEPDYGIDATIYEGPDEETSFGAAWFTAELQPIGETDAKRYAQHTLREYLGDAAFAQYETDKGRI